MKKTVSIIMALVLALTFILPGCSLLGGGSGAMDFNAKMTLKAPDPAPGDTPKVLFVGNSHTFTNDLPGMFYDLASALGHETDVYDLTEGYYTLENFADLEDDLGALLDQALAAETWDYVVLQENTGNAVSPTADEDMFPYARTLDKKIKAAGGQTAFLMTWSPKNGVESGVLKLDRKSVQTMLAENYIAIADELDDLLIPAGVAFMRCAEQYPEIELWDEDEQHPSLAGTYLAACTAYALFFQESPEGCSFTSDLDADTALKLQGVAAGLVLA